MKEFHISIRYHPLTFPNSELSRIPSPRWAAPPPVSRPRQRWNLSPKVSMERHAVPLKSNKILGKQVKTSQKWCFLKDPKKWGWISILESTWGGYHQTWIYGLSISLVGWIPPQVDGGISWNLPIDRCQTFPIVRSGYILESSRYILIQSPFSIGLFLEFHFWVEDHESVDEPPQANLDGLEVVSPPPCFKAEELDTASWKIRKINNS